MTDPPRIDFVISNPGHHVAQIAPLFQRLRRRAAVRSRVLSLCELRGFATPVETIRAAGADCRRLVRPGIRRSPGRGAAAAEGAARSWIRRLGWLLLLRRPLAAALRRPPQLAVLPNDAAFPYDRLVRLLGRRSIPFVLLQEGIRFPLPAEAGTSRYGSGGAVAIAAWGETSAEHFRRQGVPADRLILTGNPRFDDLPASHRTGSAAARRERRRLLLVTNPIDDQGFCTTEEKLRMFRRFVEGVQPLLEAGTMELWVKPHGREAAADYVRAIGDLPRSREIRVLADRPLHGLFTEVDAVVVTASSAGLEALLFGLPLGVLELPGAGFVYDYVDRGAALGLSWERSLAEQITRLIGDRPVDGDRVESYLASSLASRRAAGDLVTDLLLRCLERTDAPTA